jgi:CBS-domain-containing membrane protein
MRPDAPLPTFRVEPSTSIAQTQPQSSTPVTLHSPAVEVVTDLTQVKAATTTRTTTLHQAERTMINQGVRMLFVVTEMPSFEGLITTTDLHGNKPMRIVHERNLRHDELCVADVMTELSALDAIEFERLASATVGDLVATLQRCGRNHLLVVQAASATTPRRVRGVISRAQIERQLGQAIELNEIASSFAEIERALV